MFCDINQDQIGHTRAVVIFDNFHREGRIPRKPVMHGKDHVNLFKVPRVIEVPNLLAKKKRKVGKVAQQLKPVVIFDNFHVEKKLPPKPVNSFKAPKVIKVSKLLEMNKRKFGAAAHQSKPNKVPKVIKLSKLLETKKRKVGGVDQQPKPNEKKKKLMTNVESNANQQVRIPKKKLSKSMPTSLVPGKVAPLQTVSHKTTTNDEQKLKQHRLKLSKQIKLSGNNKRVTKRSKKAKSIVKKPCTSAVPNKEGFLVALTKDSRKNLFPSEPVTSEVYYTPETASVCEIKLLDCALNGSLQGMVTCLKYLSSTQEDIQEALESVRKNMFKKLKEAGSKLPTSTALECFQQKVVALKIFSKADATIKQAIKLYEETRYEKKFNLELVSLSHVCLSNEARQKMETHSLLIECSGQRKMLPQMNAMSQCDTLTFDKNGKALFQVPYVKNRKDQRAVTKLIMVPKENDLDNEATVLATWDLCLNDVSAHVPPSEVLSVSDDRHFFMKTLPSRHVKQANLNIDVSVAKCDVSHLTKRRHDIIVQMDTVCSWIKRFQEHPSVQKDNKFMIDANITCTDRTKMSLLHAAVILYDSKQIDNLLCLGADTLFESSDCRTAFDLAEYLQKQAHDRSNQKLENRFQCILQDLKSNMDNYFTI